MFSIILGIYLGVELLGHVITLKHERASLFCKPLCLTLLPPLLFPLPLKVRLLQRGCCTPSLHFLITPPPPAPAVCLLLSQLHFPQGCPAAPPVLRPVAFLSVLFDRLPSAVCSVRRCAARGPSSKRLALALLVFFPCALTLDTVSHTHKRPLNLYLQTLVSSCLLDIYFCASPNISHSTSKPKLLSLSRAWPSPLFSSCHHSDTTSSREPA